MADSPIKPANPATGRGLHIALAMSVALNLAVVGVIVGAMLRPDGPHGRGGPRDLGFGYYSEALTLQDRADLRRRFIRSKPGFLQERRAAQQDLQTLLVALRADPFDPVALDQAMQAQIDRLQNRLAVGQTLLRDFLVDLTPDARSAFADRLQAASTRPGPVRDRNTEN